MANFNTIIKRKQYLWLGLILVGGAGAIGGGMYLSDLNLSSEEEAPVQGEPAPDMTGVVDSNFNSKVEQHATTEMPGHCCGPEQALWRAAGRSGHTE